MSPRVGKYRNILCLLLVQLLCSGALAWGAAEEVVPLRLVALVDRDDRGESINFPTMLFYDYWASETYLLSSTGRLTIFDQKFFPLASFGSGRGMANPTGVAVDRRGYIYVCQGAVVDSSPAKSKPPRVTVYNQAFFPIREIVFAGIPELVGFEPDKVALSESGEIYLTGVVSTLPMSGVAVLSPEGKFLRILRPPENNVWRAAKKVLPVAAKADEKVVAPKLQQDSEGGTDIAAAFPAGLKPKTSAQTSDDDDDNGRLEGAYISDVKIDRQGRIYLLSREASFIYVLDAKEKYLFKFGEKGGVLGKLSNPVSLAVDLERRVIYVCDYMRHTILCYDYDRGKFIFEFGGRGLGPLWFNFPNSIDVDQRGRVMVSDLFNRRVQVIDPSISERRPLAATPAVVAAEPRPAPKEEVAALPVQPEIEVAAALNLPGSGTIVTVPSVLALEAYAPLRLPLMAVSLPPSMPSHKPPRELAPLRLKKPAPPAGPPLQIITAAPVRSPAQIPRPSAVRFASERVGRASKVAGESATGIMARFRAMPAAVGVYGPVAALLGVGSWLLYTNQ